MTINHRAEAERHLSTASYKTGDGPNDIPINPVAAGFHLGMAQVHATLTASQYLVADASAYRTALIAWREIVTRSVAWGLMHAETDNDHRNWRDLTQRLDEAGLNIDAEVDATIPQIDGDPRLTWHPPTVRAAMRANEEPPF
ncbi:hypothetical protein [Streptomyces sp. NPDC127040]|uniref:hypothetical protein n=1 Tax=Streptomyces sp. NPDC127040 TaxID=3347116 RepID=UPI00364EBB88